MNPNVSTIVASTTGVASLTHSASVSVSVSNAPNKLSAWARIVCCAGKIKSNFFEFLIATKNSVKSIFTRKVNEAEYTKNLVNNKAEASDDKLLCAETKRTSGTDDVSTLKQQVNCENTNKTTKSDITNAHALNTAINDLKQEILKISELPSYLVEHESETTDSNKKDSNDCGKNQDDLIAALEETKKLAEACLAKLKRSEEKKPTDTVSLIQKKIQHALNAEKRIFLISTPFHLDGVPNNEHLRYSDVLNDRITYWDKRISLALDELSNIAGKKIRADNPTIMRHDDPHRGMKIGGRYNELYDNEWTNALEYIDNLSCKKFDEQESCEILLDILMSSKEVCEKDKGNKENSTEHIRDKKNCGNEAKQEEINEHNNKNIARVKEKVVLELGRKLTCIDFNEKKMDKYVHKCVEICWYTFHQENGIDMFLDLPEPSRLATLNKQQYKPFTSAGDKATYIIWPSLHLCKDGAMVSRGVAQF